MGITPAASRRRIDAAAAATDCTNSHHCPSKQTPQTNIFKQARHKSDDHPFVDCRYLDVRTQVSQSVDFSKFTPLGVHSGTVASGFHDARRWDGIRM